jgi:hypothetical protein
MSGNLLFGNFTRNTGNDPIETIGLVNNSSVPVQVQIAIGKFAGPDPALMKYVALRSAFVVNEFATLSGTIYGHPNAVGAEAVAAAAYFNTPAFNISRPIFESFSSSGTTPILFDLAGNPLAAPELREKPAIVAPDGGNTTFFGSDIPQDADTFPNFFGTSAAAPHAAGVAALLLQARPTLMPAKIYRSLENTAIDMDAPGFDNNTGFGLIQASAALPTALDVTPADFDGDGVSDIGVFRNGAWFILKSSGGSEVIAWGTAGDILVPADYDGDVKVDLAVFRDGVWFIAKSSGGSEVIAWGAAGDIPVAADYDGDRKTDPAVFRDGVWFIAKSSGGSEVLGWGTKGDVPVPADYDGDGRTDPAVFRDGAWFIAKSSGGSEVLGWGTTGDVLVPADYDRDGKTDLAVFRDGVWFVAKSSGGSEVLGWGTTGDMPVPADYDGDGKIDLAVFRNGAWFIVKSSGGSEVVGWGMAGDIPIE